MAGTLALCAGAAMAQVAQAGPTTTTSTTTPATTISFAGTAQDGTALTLSAQVTDVTLSRLMPGDPSAGPAGPGSQYLSLDMETEGSTGTGPSFDAFDTVPIGDISLVLADGADVPAVPPAPGLGFLEGNYSFEVPDGTTGGTLTVTAVTVSCVEYPGAVGPNATFTQAAFGPATTAVVVPPPPVAVTVPTTTVPTIVPVHRAQPTKVTRAKKHPAHGSTALPVGAGAGGGLVVLVLLIPIWRRRAYTKADREGHVLIAAPPVLAPSPGPEAKEARADGGEPTQPPPPTSAGEDVTVNILGPIEIGGLVRDLDQKPEQEVLVFLALHPGRQFTSIELRSRIWIEGRDEPTAGTFRNYLTALRKGLAPGTVVRTGLNYALTDAVTSDWARFGRVLEEADDRAERLAEALDLVRGSPFEGAFSGRNSPYAWAGDLSHQIEVAVEKAGHELTELSLDAGDLALADAGTARVLRCLPASVTARGDHLRLGSALGGPREVERRMRAAGQALGHDVVLLEPLALTFGWLP
jgi:hypothetical protein